MPNEVELNEDGTPKEPKRVVFDDDQQKHVNEIINNRFAKITEKHEQEVARKVREAIEARNLELGLNADGSRKDPEPNSTNNNNPKPDEAAKEEYKQILENEKNKTRLAEEKAARAAKEAEDARAESLSVRKTQAMRDAAKGQNFYQIDDVLNLVGNKIVFDKDSNTWVVKENGIIRQNSSLQNMTLDEFFAEVAASRPYLVNGDMKPGVGSRESSNSTSAGLVKTKADLKTAKEKSDFIGKFGYDKYAALPAK